ncbi:TPA: hypothetical protein IAB95_05195 [Candidatus Ventrenecus avicola]|nr:hypothetical protein [Candidatus Ventrenecus avicola]
MESKKLKKKSFVKNTVLISVLVVSIIVIGISLSFAYFTMSIQGSSDTGNNQAAILNVTTTLTTADAINATSLAIIDGSEYLTKAESIEFTVTNNTDSNVNALYTINMTDITISKNMLSQYFKWALVINSDTGNAITGSFQDLSLADEGNTDTSTVTIGSKVLIADENARSLSIGATDTITLYLWLENDNNVDQLYLTNGTFSGKLSLNATPVK